MWFLLFLVRLNLSEFNALGIFGFRTGASNCIDEDIQLQIQTGDSTSTCESTVASVLSIGFSCDEPLAELNNNVLRTYCCQTCPTVEPSKAPTRFGTCLDNDNLLKQRMGYNLATCEEEYKRITAVGSSCQDKQIWNGKLEDFCCSSCNGGVLCLDHSDELDQFFGPDMMSCADISFADMCDEVLLGERMDYYCPVSCGLCPEYPATTMPDQDSNLCDDIFNPGSGEVCDDIGGSDRICRVLANLNEYMTNCDEFCAAHGTDCVNAWVSLDGSCHGGTWFRQDCDHVSEGHICECQDASTSAPTLPVPTYHPTAFTQPTKAPVTAGPSTSPSIFVEISMPTANPTRPPDSSTSSRDVISDLRNTLRLQEKELNDLNAEFANAQDYCAQRFSEIEAHLSCDAGL